MSRIISHKMGQVPSNSTSMDNSNAANRRKSFRSPFTRRKKHKQPLSATFQAPSTNNFETLNINTATVEQFMTLPGINRRIAQSIVEHRSAIGGRFQRVDDLALVSGIGAEKLDIIRPEICVKRLLLRSVQGSIVSSRTPSIDSVLSEPFASCCSPKQLVVNINSSTVFQLQQVNGINQEIAAKIVEYRNRKGHYKSVDDLIKVKGISHVRLSAIRSALCVENKDNILLTARLSQTLPASMTSCTTSTPIRNGYNTNVNANTNADTSHRKSISMPMQMNSNINLTNGFKDAPVNDIFDLLGAYSHRPIVEDNFNYKRNGHTSIRIASWNLDKMSTEKSSNLGVREVICRTILENKLSIICLQEVIESFALYQICDELNHPTLRRIIEWKENSRCWKYFNSRTCGNNNDHDNDDSNDDWECFNGLGFIYDASICDVVNSNCFDIPLVDSAMMDCSQPTAYLATFKLSDWTCSILNTYLRYFDLTNLNQMISTVETFLSTHSCLSLSDIYFVAGDFTGLNYQNELTKYHHLLRHPHSNPHRQNGWKNAEKSNPKQSNIGLDELGFYTIFESNSTATGGAESDKSTMLTMSSCNILCRDKMPSIRNAFRDALYKTKSPLSIFQKYGLIQVPFQVPSSSSPSSSSSASSSASPSTTTATAAPATTTTPQIGEKLCGYSGIIRQGLCHMAIPRGWSWGGPASSHCPIWIEVFKRKNRRPSPQPLMKAYSEELTAQNADAASTCQSLGQDSLNSSNLSYHLLNGVSSGSVGNLNESSDSVFIDNEK